MTSAYASVDHPGIEVPADRRSWTVAWSDYRPVDITPPELRADALAGDVEEWITDTVDTPQAITDWPQRQEQSLVPFTIDAAGRPLNPVGRTGRAGRNLGGWGENTAADPVVVAGTGSQQRILLIQRSDVRQWALPGGMVDPGETASRAAVRELQEETGVDLTQQAPDAILRRGYVPDWRATDHAWVCSTAALYVLPDVVVAEAGDDATAVGWFAFSDLDGLRADLGAVAGLLYSAHVEILQAALAVL